MANSLPTKVKPERPDSTVRAERLPPLSRLLDSHWPGHIDEPG